MDFTESRRFHTFEEDRTTLIRGTLKDANDGAALSAVDVSSGTVSVRFRAYKMPPATDADYLIDGVMTKTDGANGIVTYYATFTSDYGQVACEVVLVDSAVTGQPTPTTYRERVFKKWMARVLPSVQPA